jgi:hypothetical protein
MTGYRFFFPFRDTPTLIWIKEKEGIFCSREPRRIFQSVDIGPVAENLTMPKAIFDHLPRSRSMPAPVGGIMGFINENVIRIPCRRPNS